MRRSNNWLRELYYELGIKEWHFPLSSMTWKSNFFSNTRVECQVDQSRVEVEETSLQRFCWVIRGLIFGSEVRDLVYKVWQWLVRLTKQRKEEHNSKLHVWAVSSSCSWNCMFGQWAHLAYIVPQLLTGLESPNRDSKSPNRDSCTECCNRLLTRSIL